MKNDFEIIIVGTGGHARVLADTAVQAGFILKGFIDINYKGQNEKILDFPVIGSSDVLEQLDPKKHL